MAKVLNPKMVYISDFFWS